MNTTIISHFKDTLEQEKTRLEGELSGIATVNPNNPNDWHTEPGDTTELNSHEEVADRLEDNEEREATEKVLAERLREVTDALQKIEAGSYGVCEIDNEPIEHDRLEANPAARTCKAHLND